MEVVKVLRTLKASFFLSILLILPICFSFSPSTAYAAESDAVAISGATQDFDLTKGPEQSHQIKLKDGTVAVIGIRTTLKKGGLLLGYNPMVPGQGLKPLA